MATAKGVERLTEYTKAAQALLSKSEGRDKFLATLQYAVRVAAPAAGSELPAVSSPLSNGRPLRR